MFALIIMVISMMENGWKIRSQEKAIWLITMMTDIKEIGVMI